MAERGVESLVSCVITEEERIVGKLIYPKLKKLKPSCASELHAIRLLIISVGLVVNLINHGMDLAVEKIIYQLNLTELANLAIVCFRLGHKELTNFLKFRCRNWVLLRIFFDNKMWNELTDRDRGLMKAENINLEKILTSERGLVNFSKALFPTDHKTMLKIDAFNLPWGDAVLEKNFQLQFNPCFDLMAALTEQGLKIFSFGGKCKEKFGTLVYSNQCAAETANPFDFVFVSWSPDGLHLMAGERRSKNHPIGSLKLFRHQPILGNLKMLKTSPIHFSIRHHSQNLWTGSSTFQLLSSDGDVIQYNITKTTLEQKTLVEKIQLKLNYREKVPDDKPYCQFGCLTFSSSNPNLISMLKQCNEIAEHGHDTVLLLEMLPEENDVKILASIYVPGLVLNLEFSPSNELWILWSENSREIWDDWADCLVDLSPEGPRTCLLGGKGSAWLSTDSVTVRGPNLVGLGFFSLETKEYSALRSLNTISPSLQHFFTLTESFRLTRTFRGLAARLYETAYVRRMYLNTDFVGVNLGVGANLENVSRRCFRVC